jgi:hypothetical protein
MHPGGFEFWKTNEVSLPSVQIREAASSCERNRSPERPALVEDADGG